LSFQGKIGIAERKPAGGIILPDGPDDRRTMALLVVGHRQQGERTGGIEDLIGDMVVRPLVPKHRHDRLMSILPPRNTDSCSFARSGIATVRRHEQRRMELPPVVERYAHTRLVAADVGHSRFPQQPAVLTPSARDCSAERRCRFSCIQPSGSSSSGSKCRPPGCSPSATEILRIEQPGAGRWSDTPIVSSMRMELDETALVRPSKAALVRGAGSAGSTTIADRPLLSRADASARPTIPPPNMITSARSMAKPLPPGVDDAKKFA